VGVLRQSTSQERSSPRQINRRKFFGLAASAGVTAIAADGILFEPMRPSIVRKEILLKRWPARMDGFTIALLSDFHYDPIFSVHPIQSAVEIVNRARPDLVLLTGDFVTSPPFGDRSRGLADAEPCAQLLQKLQAPHGRWAVMGNHDVIAGTLQVTAALRAAGLAVLSNSAVPIEHNGGRFWLAGVGDALLKTADLHSALQPVPPDEAVILMAHEPDYADYVARYPVDLQLSGHSHGGQIRLPLAPPLYLPPLARKYISGMHRIGELILYTNIGLGTITIPVRLNCPPEVTLITVRRGQAGS
jgi:predicted MPP superfamily phosphohydrolase